MFLRIIVSLRLDKLMCGWVVKTVMLRLTAVTGRLVGEY